MLRSLLLMAIIALSTTSWPLATLADTNLKNKPEEGFQLINRNIYVSAAKAPIYLPEVVGVHPTSASISKPAQDPMLSATASTSREGDASVPISLARSSAELLAEDFMDLFDELWRIKKHTAESIIRLKSQPIKPQLQQAFAATSPLQQPPKPMDDTETTTTRAQSTGNWTQTSPNHSQIGLLNGPTPPKNQKPNGPKRNSPVGFVSLGNILDSMRARISHLFGSLSVRKQAQNFVVESSKNWTGKTRIRRQLASGCASDRVSQCRIHEKTISTTLNSSFPGTFEAIEDGCKHIAYLLANCWPGLLRQLNYSSKYSHNKQVVAVANEYLSSAAPTRGGRNRYNQAQAELACNIEPNVSELVRDRIVWMWLNMCLDRAFRKNYVENLSCLSLWSHERAQLVCSDEYRRMQAYVTSNNSILVAGPNNQHPRIARENSEREYENAMRSLNKSRAELVQQPMNRPFRSTATGLPLVDDSLGGLEMTLDSVPQMHSSMVQSAAALMQSDTEFHSKMHCCVFDHFIRCVNRQALSDCGHKGAQFVVDFMSRIGTDDLKYICNSQPQNNQRTSMNVLRNNGTASISLSNIIDTSPFIESNYCNEPRIQYAILTSTGYRPDGLDQTKNNHLNGMHSTGKVRNRNQLNAANFNKDPAFLGKPLSTTHSGCNTLNAVKYVSLLATLLCSFLVDMDLNILLDLARI